MVLAMKMVAQASSLGREGLKSSCWRARMSYYPWSNSSPRGEEEPVRRACLPSIPSRVWERKRRTATATCPGKVEYKYFSGCQCA